MGESFRATGVITIASQFNGIARVIAVLAAILTTLGRYAIAGRMGALFILTHKSQTLPLWDDSAIRLFPD
jgi:hypothetical protein